jgi:hypothetical protein
MNSIPIDTQKKWVFRFSNLVPNGVPIKFEEKDGMISFSIPLDEAKILNIKLIASITFGIEGHYSFMERNKQLSEGSVTFQTLEEGRRYQGVPEGVFSRHIWCLEKVS